MNQKTKFQVFKNRSAYFAGMLGAVVLGILFFLDSCVPPEQPLIDIPDPSVQTIEIDVDGLSSHYYSLSQKKVVASNKIADWDLRLCAQSDKYYVYLNTAKHMRIARYDGKFGDLVKVSMIKNWQSDIVKNGKDITAMGSWGDFSFTNPKSFGYTYILDMGYLNYLQEFGFRKIQVLGCSDNFYTIKYGALDDPEGDTIQIEKKGDYNNLFVSLNKIGKVVEIEPPSASWDLNFTQFGLSQLIIRDSVILDTAYTWTDFIVFNNTQRQIACDSFKTFDSITFWDAENYNYSKAIDFIGNSWRSLVAQPSTFAITERRNFIIKDNKNHIYKIEMIAIDKSNPKVSKISFRVKNL